MELMVKAAVTLLMLLLALTIAKQVYEEAGPLISAEAKKLVDAAYNILLNGIRKASQTNPLEASRCSLTPSMELRLYSILTWLSWIL